MVSIAVGIGSPAYTSERAFTALNFVRTALLEGHEVRVFLFEDGIFLAKKGQDPGNFANPTPWLEEILEAGVEVRFCGTCATERSLSEDEVIERVRRGGMPDFVGMVTSADRCVIF
ncbi:MAG TPA: hypothetical protein EYP43_01545 [Thermoplasmata archaeon]|nr:hypothetical protein [Thermoplasmata archaeon]